MEPAITLRATNATSLPFLHRATVERRLLMVGRANGVAWGLAVILAMVLVGAVGLGIVGAGVVGSASRHDRIDAITRSLQSSR